jgi:hypothetical protein
MHTFKSQHAYLQEPACMQRWSCGHDGHERGGFTSTLHANPNESWREHHTVGCHSSCGLVVSLRTNSGASVVRAGASDSLLTSVTRQKCR